MVACYYWHVRLASASLHTSLNGNFDKERRVRFDYRDLLDISDLQTNPQSFIAEQLKNMKAAGIGSMAVYESTLGEFKESRHIEMYNSRDAAALTQTFGDPNENFTYVLFKDSATQQS